MLGLGLGLRSTGQSLQQKAMSILRSFGPDAHSYPFSTRQGAYQTSAGPVVAAVNDPVGLELDALGTVGPELVTNSGGPFTTTTGYVVQATGTMSVDAGRLKVVQLAAWTDGIFYYLPAVTVGCTVKVTVEVDLGTAPKVQIQLGYVYNNGSSGQRDITASGTYDLFGVWVGGGTGGITFKAPIASTFYVSSVHAVEVTGNHAAQTTAGNRPTLAQDGGGRYYASFNGTNQSLALSSVPFQMADDFAVVACVHLSTAGASSTIFLVTGVGYVQLPWLYFDATGHVKVTLYDGTNAFEFASAATFIATTIVVSLVKVGDVFRLRVNGSQVGTLTATMLNPPVTLSSMGAFDNGGVSSVLHGAIYDLDPIKGTVTDAQLLILEKAAAQKAGLVL